MKIQEQVEAVLRNRTLAALERRGIAVWRLGANLRTEVLSLEFYPEMVLIVAQEPYTSNFLRQEYALDAYETLDDLLGDAIAEARKFIRAKYAAARRRYGRPENPRNWARWLAKLGR
jgi:hypothetical protein